LVIYSNLQQMLMNLMLNSTDALKEVNAQRELTITSKQAENSHPLISVYDIGLGLPAERADQIFNPFSTTKPQGSGMGLSISRTIVDGYLGAKSSSPHGACFVFTLPNKAEAAG
jgi:signal transduction histidine kinase